MDARSLWSRFSADPRSHGQVRASDADRAVVTDVLSEAYALGQLDVEEFEERTEAASRVKSLGEIPDLIHDLIVAEADDLASAELDDAARAQALARLDADRIPITPEQIDAAARKYYRDRVRQALIGLIAGPAGVTVAIWAFTSIMSSTVIFFWPLFVMIPMMFGLFARVGHKHEIIRKRKRDLARRARAKLGDAEAQRQLEKKGTEDDEEELDDEAFGHGLQPPHPLAPPYSPGYDPSHRDEMRRRHGERHRRRGNPWD